MVRLRWKWVEAFEFAGYDEETGTYEDDYVPMRYLVEFDKLLKKFRIAVFL